MMRLKEAEQIILFQFYLHAQRTKGPFRISLEDINLLMSDYKVGGEIIGAAVDELRANAKLLWNDDADGGQFRIGPSGIREVEEFLADKQSALMLTLSKHEKNLATILGELNLVPAADRVVPLDHNSAAFKDAFGALDELVSELKKSPNDLGSVSAEDRVVVLSNLQHGLDLLNAPTIRIGHYKAFIQSSLTFIAGAAANGVIGDLAAKALGLWERLVGLLT